MQDSLLTGDVNQNDLGNIVSDLIKDTSVAGDIHQNITINDGESRATGANIRVTCKACNASGNFTIFVCDSISCLNNYCEHCRNVTFPKKCSNCIQDILLEQQIERDKQIVQERILAAEHEKRREKRRQKEAAEEAEMMERANLVRQQKMDAEKKLQGYREIHDRKRQEESDRRQEESDRKRREASDRMRQEEADLKTLRVKKYNSKPTMYFRNRKIMVPLLQLICWYILVKPNWASVPSEERMIFQIFLLILSLMLTSYIAYVSMFSSTSRIGYTRLAENGDEPVRAIVYVLSPVISMTIFLIMILFFGVAILYLMATAIFAFILLILAVKASNYQ